MKLTMDRGVKLLLAMNVVLIASLLGFVVFFALGNTPGRPAQLDPSPSPSPDLIEMGLAHIPTTNSCLLCHEAGGSAGLKPIPAVGHPLTGWRACGACHTEERLGQDAPGHVGITDDECLNCHQEAQDGTAITQPHFELQDQRCNDCHGSYAHLPTSMVEQNENECWLCHKPTAYPPPAVPHVHDSTTECRACHQSAEVGNLPIDHALRSDSTCVLCHDIAVAEGGPSALPSLWPSPSPTLVPSPTVAPSASPSPGG
jgi:hypothetical protein